MLSGSAARTPASTVLAPLARATWRTLRWPLLALLVVLEPVIRVLLAGSALLLVLTALFFALVRLPEAFPFWGMLGVSTGLVLILALYYAVLRVLSA